MTRPRATTTSDAAGGRSTVPRRPLAFAPYLLIALLPIAAAAPLFRIQWDRDEAAYATIALGMRHGLVPYRDLFDHKPPLIYVTYWLALLPSVSPVVPRLLAAAALGATALVLIRAARSFNLRPSFAMTAGLLCALSAFNVRQQLNSNIEPFMVLPMTASLVALLRDERSLRWCIAAGLLSGIAVLFKTSAVFPAGALVVYLLARRRPNVRGAVGLAAGAIVPIALCGILFVALSAGHAFWYANVTYNRLYIDAVPLSMRVRQVVSFDLGVALLGAWFWVLALLGLLLSLLERGRRSWLLVLWGAGCYIGVVFPGRGFPHYYAQLTPPAAISGAIALQWMSEHFRSRRFRFSVYAVFAPLGLLQLLLYASFVASAPERAQAHALTTREYECQTSAREVGEWLRAHTVDGDRVYDLGRDTQIYAYAGRLPAARFMYDRPFALDPSTATDTAMQLRAARPRYVVDTLACTPDSAPPAPLASLIAEQYRPVASVSGASIYEAK